MATAVSGPCSCPCCKKEKCTCTGEPGKDCSCACCQRHACICGAQQRQSGGGQQEACKCPCCVRKSCTCKQPSDCTCAECPKHACLCAGASEKKKKVPCDCCCCKTGTTCCTETQHQKDCDCRCCKEQTCACCKINQARAAGGVVEPASGKMISGAVHDIYKTDTSSSIRSSQSACIGSGTIPGASCQAVAPYCRGRWNGNFVSICRPCRPCNVMHLSSNHMQCGKSTESQYATTTCKRYDAEADTMNHFSGTCRNPNCRSAYPPCCIPSYVPCGFVAPRFVLCGCARKLDASYSCPPVQPCDRDCCCSRNISRCCCCHSYVKGPAGRTVARKTESAADTNEADVPSDKRDSSASPVGKIEGGSSSSGAAESHSEVEHLYARNDVFMHCAGWCHCWPCLTTRNVAVHDHEWQRRQQTQRLNCVAEHQRQQSTNEERPQQLHQGEEGQRSSACILDFNGRILLECKTREKVLLRRMRPADYPDVRALLPRVSRCTLVLTEQQIHDVLSSPVFYAWCCFSVEPNAYQQGQGDTFAQTVTQKQELEQHPTTQQRTEPDGQQQHPPLQEGHLLHQEVKENVPEYYREKRLVAYCELVLQPRLGRKTDGRLERVVVDKDFCGRGIASEMCAAVLAAVRERQLCEYVDLTVEKDDARHIYEAKLGFREVETTVLRRHV